VATQVIEFNRVLPWLNSPTLPQVPHSLHAFSPPERADLPIRTGDAAVNALKTVTKRRIRKQSSTEAATFSPNIQ
jgi:hypothetical protein